MQRDILLLTEMIDAAESARLPDSSPLKNTTNPAASTSAEIHMRAVFTEVLQTGVPVSSLAQPVMRWPLPPSYGPMLTC